MEYQHLHQDGGQDAQLVSSHRLEWARDVGVDVNAEEPEEDFVGVRKAMEATAGVTISWCLSDWTFENGPIRQIPGSVRRSPRPSLAAPEFVLIRNVALHSIRLCSRFRLRKRSQGGCESQPWSALPRAAASFATAAAGTAQRQVSLAPFSSFVHESVSLTEGVAGRQT